jgi:hypothetical protein
MMMIHSVVCDEVHYMCIDIKGLPQQPARTPRVRENTPIAHQHKTLDKHDLHASSRNGCVLFEINKTCGLPQSGKFPKTCSSSA